jgi:hypothetical protein
MLHSFVASFRSDRIWGSVGPIEALYRACSADSSSMAGCSLSLLSLNQSDGSLLMVVAVECTALLMVRKKSEYDHVGLWIRLSVIFALYSWLRIGSRMMLHQLVSLPRVEGF